MRAVDATTAAELLFAAGIVLAAAALAGAVTLRAGRRMLVVDASLVAALATGAWVAFALDPGEEIALAAAGTTAALLGALAALPLRRALERAHRIEAERARGEAHLREVVAREVERRSAELEGLLARSRADSLSLLQGEERRIAEERREIGRASCRERV